METCVSYKKYSIVFILTIFFAITMLIIFLCESALHRNKMNVTIEEISTRLSTNISQLDESRTTREATFSTLEVKFKTVLQHCLDKAKGLNLTILNDRYYYFHNFTFMKTWKRSREFCRQHGMDLVSIENEVENLAIKNYLNQKYGTSKTFDSIWIGGTDSQKEGDWIWIATNQRLKFKKFHPEKMHNKDDENCLYAWRQNSDMLWGDDNCRYLKPFICEMYDSICYI